jgi:DNA repair exonuclease SbcCD ATPase subunit
VQLLRLEVRNWVHHRHQVCEFTRGLVAILGENGSGKSSLFGALKWLLTGENPNYGGKADNISQYAKEGEPSFATLEFEHGGHIACVTRHLRPSTEQATFTLDGTETARGEKAVTAAIEKLLGVDAKFISRFIIVGQTEIFSFIDDSQTETDKFFQRLFNTAKADKCQDALGKNLAKISIPEVLVPSEQLQAAVDTAASELGGIDAELALLPSMGDYLAAQQEDQKIVNAWDERSRAADELLKLDSDAAQLGARAAAAKAERAQYDADIQALDEAASGQDAAIAAARTALGHWQSYKNVAESRKKLQATRDHVEAVRAKDPQPPQPGPLSTDELRRDSAAKSGRIKAVREFIRMFDEHGEAECPTCHTPSSQLVAQVEKHKEELETLTKTVDDLSAAYAKQMQLETAWTQWESRERDRTQAMQRVEAAEQGLQAVTPPELSEDALTQTVADYDSFVKARQEIAPLAATAASTCARLEGQLSTIEARRKELTEKLLRAEVTEADVHVAQLRMAQLSQQLAARDKLSQDRANAAWRLREAERAHEETAANERKAVQMREWVARAERTREALKNAPRVVAQRNLQRLEAAVNELLQVFRVNFQVKVAEDGTPTFIAEFYDGRRQVAQRLSIGQKTVLAIAFRVAVNAQFAEEIGLLALDEPTASLDQPRIQALAPVLEKLRELSTAKGLQCLLVTHATSLSHLFESAIELEPPELRHATIHG